MDEPVWDATVFTKNRDRLLEGEMAEEFFDEVVEQARAQNLLSDEHFTVDGTLIEAWAGQKSFQRKDEPNATARDRRQQSDGELSRREAQQSTRTNRRPIRRRGWHAKSGGSEAKLSYSGHLLMENRNGLVVDTRADQATGTAERDAALVMAGTDSGGQRRHGGRRQGYDTQGFRERSARS